MEGMTERSYVPGIVTLAILKAPDGQRRLVSKESDSADGESKLDREQTYQCDEATAGRGQMHGARVCGVDARLPAWLRVLL